MLARSGFRDDAFCAQPLCEERLAERVIDLVSARVREVFAFEPDFGAPPLREPRCERQGRRSPDPCLELTRELGLKVRRVQMLPYPPLQSLERGDERLRNITAAERTEAPACIRKLTGDRIGEQPFLVGDPNGHCHSHS